MNKNSLSLLVFLFTCGNLTSIFTVFSSFGMDFFLNGFLNPFIVHFSTILLSQPNFHFSLGVFCPYVGI